MDIDDIQLSGFRVDYIDQEIVNKIIRNNLKVFQRYPDLARVSIHLKKKTKDENELYEIAVSAKARKMLSANVSGFNPYKTLSDALEKIKSELSHLS